MKTLFYRNEEKESAALDWYEADGKTLYCYIHGGGLSGGNKSEGRAVAEYLQVRGVDVISVNYRMYPDGARFPLFIQDCADALAFVLKQKDFDTVVIGGSSAGGYLSQMLYMNPEYLQKAGVPAEKVKGYFFNAGQPTCHFIYLKEEKQMDSRRIWIDESAPLFYLTETLAPEQPYILIACAETDMVNRTEQNKMLCTALKHFGFPPEKISMVVYPGETHCSYLAKDFYFEDTLALIRKAEGVQNS